MKGSRRIAYRQQASVPGADISKTKLRLFRVPGTGRRSDQAILKEINTEYLLEELMLKLKLQYFDHLM